MSHPFDWSAGYPSRRAPVFGTNVVSTSHPLAAQAGMRMLWQGGNAVDATIAAAAVMALVEPCSNGLGSDAFCILWDGKRLHGLNASGRAPAAWAPAYFHARYGEDARTPPQRGWDSVTVPGAVAGWVALSRRFGRLPFADLLEPAIAVAERGYLVSPNVRQKWAAAAQVADLVRQPGFAEAFLPRGRAPQVGEHFALPGAARALRRIGETQGAALYGGEIAQALEASARAHGAALTAADMAAFEPEWVEPIGQDYRGFTVHEMPPNGQGLVALLALGMLGHFDLAGLGADSVAANHLQIEAIKLAFADVYRYVADPAAMQVRVQDMLAPDYLAARARLIDPARAQRFSAGIPPRGGTIYLTAADDTGMMVSFIQSNYMGFGSGVVLPEWGLSLQNRGHGFSLDPARENVVAPGKRPFHTIIPGFITRAGAPVMSFGVMGAHMQPQGHVQTLVRMLDYAQNPQAACDAPRWRFEGGLTIDTEAGMSPALVAGLAEKGHDVARLTDSYQDFGAGQFIWRMGDPAREGYAAASDPRRDGQAVVW
ncbi:gamma-glutamyltransferase family protein [Xanthobacter sp. V3C-3]|uniref:gamma-glutamyltransferase family protein n=1 Tax=Xanthobacter lutulentifluminis TaxID=3119935 RepID=UPI00372834ED